MQILPSQPPGGGEGTGQGTAVIFIIQHNYIFKNTSSDMKLPSNPESNKVLLFFFTEELIICIKLCNFEGIFRTPLQCLPKQGTPWSNTQHLPCKRPSSQEENSWHRWDWVSKEPHMPWAGCTLKAVVLWDIPPVGRGCSPRTVP